MQNPTLKVFLRELGLQKPEVDVFMACLQVGSGPASSIAGVAGLNRVTTYEILKRLSKKGFVKIRAKTGSRTKYFVPEDLADIKARLDSRLSNLQESIGKIDGIKEEFKALYKLSEKKPLVLFYEGKDGVKSALNDTLIQKPNELLSFASAEWLKTEFSDSGFLKEYWAKRVSQKIPCRCIVPRTEDGSKFFTKERNQRELRQPRFLLPSLYDFKNEIDIYNDTVSIVSLVKNNEHSILIRSKSVADSMRALFSALWELSERE